MRIDATVNLCRKANPKNQRQQAPDRATAGRHSAKEKKEKKGKKEKKERKKDKEKRGPAPRDNDDGDGGGSLVEPVGTAAGGGACSRPLIIVDLSCRLSRC